MSTLSAFPNPNASVGVSASVPNPAPDPDTIGFIAIQTNHTSPTLTITQTDPLALITSYSTTLDKDGIIQNNSGGTGFNLQSAQNISLTCPIGQTINVPNGNNISLTQGNYTSEYRQDGVQIAEFLAGNYTGNAQLFTSGGSAQMFVSGGNLATANTQYVRIETPFTGDASIEHSVVGTSRNLGISSTGNITMSADQQTFTTTNNSTPSVPAYTFTNTSAANSSHPVIRFNRPNVNSQVGDSLSVISTFANDAGGTNREWSRIQTKTENVSVSPANQDSTISFFTSVNGAVAEVFNLNGAQNENNMFRPLDMNNNEIRSNSGDMTLTTTASTGTGNITMSAKANVSINGTNCSVKSQSGVNVGAVYTNSGVSGIVELEATSILAITGTALQSATAGGNSGQHLRINLNGTFYKIKLEND
jgi:hypothetical protein